MSQFENLLLRTVENTSFSRAITYQMFFLGRNADQLEFGPKHLEELAEEHTHHTGKAARQERMGASRLNIVAGTETPINIYKPYIDHHIKLHTTQLAGAKASLTPTQPPSAEVISLGRSERTRSDTIPDAPDPRMALRRAAAEDKQAMNAARAKQKSLYLQRLGKSLCHSISRTALAEIDPIAAKNENANRCAFFVLDGMKPPKNPNLSRLPVFNLEDLINEALGREQGTEIVFDTDPVLNQKMKNEIKSGVQENNRDVAKRLTARATPASAPESAKA